MNKLYTTDDVTRQSILESKLDLANMSIEELEELVERALDMILAKKEPVRVVTRTLTQDLKMCYNKVYFSSLKLANNRAKNLSKKYKVNYRVYECPNCCNFHLTTRVLDE